VQLVKVQYFGTLWEHKTLYDKTICTNLLVCQTYNASLWSPPQRACTEKSKLNMI